MAYLCEVELVGSQGHLVRAFGVVVVVHEGHQGGILTGDHAGLGLVVGAVDAVKRLGSDRVQVEEQAQELYPLCTVQRTCT